MFRNCVVVLVIVGLFGCTTMQTIQQPSPTNIQKNVDVGDQVSIDTRAGRHFDLKVTSVTEAELFGTDKDDKRWRVPYKDIEKIEVKEASALKTTGVALAIVGGVLAVLFILGAHAFGHGVKDSVDGN